MKEAEEEAAGEAKGVEEVGEALREEGVSTLNNRCEKYAIKTKRARPCAISLSLKKN